MVPVMRVLSLVGLLAGLLLVLAACSGSGTAPAASGGAGAQSSNSGNQPRLTVDKPAVDFGKVPYDQRVTPTWKLTNSGNAPLQIKDFKLDVVEGC